MIRSILETYAELNSRGLLFDSSPIRSSGLFVIRSAYQTLRRNQLGWIMDPKLFIPGIKPGNSDLRVKPNIVVEDSFRLVMN